MVVVLEENKVRFQLCHRVLIRKLLKFSESLYGPCLEEYRGESFLFHTESVESTGKCNDRKEYPSEMENSGQGARGYEEEGKPSRTLPHQESSDRRFCLICLGWGFLSI